jgi:hypothetical protein
VIAVCFDLHQDLSERFHIEDCPDQLQVLATASEARRLWLHTRPVEQ